MTHDTCKLHDDSQVTYELYDNNLSFSISLHIELSSIEYVSPSERSHTEYTCIN